MGYQSLVEKQYTKAVADAIHFGPFNDVTPGYANLVASAQSLIDQQNISPAQQADARNANHLLILNMLGGAFGNAPGPEGYAASTTLGAGQSLVGLMQPAIGGGSGPIGRFFDTSHVAQVQAANHAADLSLGDYARLLATQGAYDAGSLIVIDHQPGPNDHLPPGGIWIGPGMLDSNGKVQNSPGFQDWWNTGQNPIAGQSGQPLSHYVDQIQKAMTIHQ